jgi:hypothetical protein
VVNAGGTYARQMGEWSGLQLPMTSMTHHYFVTDEVPEFRDLERELPVIRDDKQVSGYIRMEQKKGLIGIYEKANPNRLARSLPVGSRERAVRRRLRPGHAVAGGKPEPHADLRRTGHHARRAWRDQPPARWQPADRPGAGRAQLLVLLRHADRHRLGPRPDPRTGALDGAWRRRYLDARL